MKSKGYHTFQRESRLMFYCTVVTMSALVLMLSGLVAASEGARILGIFPNDGYSQYILGSALMKGLAAKGHQVTVISPFGVKTPVENYKEITVKMEPILPENETLYKLESFDMFGKIKSLYYTSGLHITEGLLKDGKVQKLLHSDAAFDLVISELFTNEAHMGFAHHFQTPLILFCSLGAVEWVNHLVANPAPFSHVPVISSGYSDHMTFWQRLRNTAAGLLDTFYKHLAVFPKQNALLQKYFPGAPDLKDLMYNASLILLNSHVAMNQPMAHVPNMIEIGGFHVAPKKLPDDIQRFLDSARDGAVFFSMGSNLRTSDLSRAKIAALLRTFSRLKQKVLWKWEDENLEGKPDNVMVGKWLPQQDILAHPNIRVFITHGGLLSVTESVYNGVPLIIFPVFADQKMNAEVAVLNGWAIKLSVQEITEEKLGWALNEILTSSSYREAAKRRSRIFHDRPMKPMDTAVFWVEYVLRHPGVTHLRSAALNLYWYQYLLLDVIGFTIVVALSIVMLCKILFCRISISFKVKYKENKQ